MGGGSSTLRLSQNPKQYKENAARIAKLPDDILTLFFQQGDFLDLLSLSNLANCPNFVFATRETLQQLFDAIKVYPKKGKKGEILFASIAQLSPGLDVKLPSTAMKKPSEDQIALQNALCVEVSYFFVRTFQIYSALSLTIMDTDPTRRLELAKQPISVGIPKSSGPRPAVFMARGGGKGFSAFAQVYGVKKNPLIGTLFEPFIEPFTVNTSTPNILFIGEPAKGKLEITFPADNASYFVPIDSTDSFSFEVLYTKGTIRQTLQASLVKDDKSIIFNIEDQEVEQFVKPSGQWTFLNPKTSGYATPENIVGFLINSINEAVENHLRRLGYQVSGSSATMGSTVGLSGASAGVSRASVLPGPRSVQVGVSTAPSGSKAFETFEDVKRPFTNRARKEGRIKFPKAYCVGRAMQLLNPIFTSELLPNQKYQSQICSKNLDFETAANPWLPREDRSVRSNIYFQSLVSLYYDAYEVQGKDIRFIQTETGRSELRNASRLIANLYFISGPNAETFLESNQQFRRTKVCANSDVKLEIQNDEFVRTLQSKVIKPMLDFQENHNKRVEALLRKMFSIKYTKDPKTGAAVPLKMEFTKSYLSGGIDSVNTIGKEARALLLDYYQKSEGYYILGVKLFEQYNSRTYWSAVA